MDTLDLDFYEYVVLINMMKGTDEYRASCIEHLTPDLFYNADTKLVCESLCSFYIENDAAPSMSELISRIKSKKDKVNLSKFKRHMDQIWNDSFHPTELLKNTENFIQQRMMKKSVDASLEELADREQGQIDTSRLKTELEEAMSVSLIDNLGLDFISDVDSFVEKMLAQDQYISTGFPTLDAELGGGLLAEGKAIYCISGETNVGKSIVLANIGANLIQQGYNVAVVTLEMSEFQYGMRFASLLTGRTQGALRLDPTDLQQWVGEFEGGNTMFIKEFPCRSITINTVKGYLRKLKRVKGFMPDVVLIDYHGLLNPTKAQGARHLDMQYVTQETRAATFFFECPWITAAQLNRPPKEEKHAPGLDRVAGSWDMLSDMDYNINIYQSQEHREIEKIGWVIRKARNGRRDINHLWDIDYTTLTLKECNSAPIDMDKHTEEIVEAASKSALEREADAMPE